MLTRELLEKVKRIELSTRGLVQDVLAGEYHSAFKGRGMEFSEVKEYTIGDDVRNIDWNVTARTGKPFVKHFEEERELTMMLVVDVSASGRFASNDRYKRELAAELCAILTFSASRNNDKTGLILFSDDIEKFIPARKGSKHVLRVIRELLYFEPVSKKTNIAAALEFLNKTSKRKATVFVVSDFMDTGFETAMRVVAKKHDVIAIRMQDPVEQSLPVAGWVDFEDLETGQTYVVNTAGRSFKEAYRSHWERNNRLLLEAYKNAGIDHIDITTGQDYIEPIVSFFKTRIKRKQTRN
jgi:uncharacterized protein (DUF58 family)